MAAPSGPGSPSGWLDVTSAVLPLSACANQVALTPEITAAVDAYADALAEAFVTPAAEGGALRTVVVNYKERYLVARANVLVGPYKSTWETPPRP